MFHKLFALVADLLDTKGILQLLNKFVLHTKKRVYRKEEPSNVKCKELLPFHEEALLLWRSLILHQKAGVEKGFYVKEGFAYLEIGIIMHYHDWLRNSFKIVIEASVVRDARKWVYLT